MLLTAVGDKILVRIDKKKQEARTRLPSGIYIPTGWEYMNYFLQYGEIVSVGGEVSDPIIQVGRTALFHHRIEAESNWLMHVEPNGDEIRVVRTTSDAFNYQFYGVVDEEGKIIPAAKFVFLWPERSKLDLVEIEDPTNPHLRFKAQVSRTESGLYTAELEKPVDDKLHFESEVAAISPDDEDLVPGDIIMAGTDVKYPFDYLDKKYWIVQKDFILLKITYGN